MSGSRHLIVLALGTALAWPAAAGDDCHPLDPSDDGTGLATPLVLSELAPGEHVELFNMTAEPIDLEAGSFWLCSPFQYASLALIGDGLVIPAGGYAIVPFPESFTDADSGGEVILYRDITLPIDFADGTKMVDFVCWGENPHFSRQALAESVGKWSGECPGPLSEGAIHRRAASPGNGIESYDVDLPPSPTDCVSGGPVGPDLNNDGTVNVEDLVAVMIGWGPCPDESEAFCADANGDGVVDVADLILVLLAWSPEPP